MEFLFWDHTSYRNLQRVHAGFTKIYDWYRKRIVTGMYKMHISNWRKYIQTLRIFVMGERKWNVTSHYVVMRKIGKRFFREFLEGCEVCVILIVQMVATFEKSITWARFKLGELRFSLACPKGVNVHYETKCHFSSCNQRRLSNVVY